MIARQVHVGLIIDIVTIRKAVLLATQIWSMSATNPSQG